MSRTTKPKSIASWVARHEPARLFRAELVRWRCGHGGCSQWGSLFKHPNGRWLGRPDPAVAADQQERRCHFHSGLFMGGL